MAPDRSAEVPIATMRMSEGDRTPIVRRPKRQDALDLAHATFRSGVRVEMGTLAAQLGISQPTLYRWVGTREQLLDAVLERITDETVESALAAASGDGDERVLDFVRRFADASGTFQAGHRFIAREPELALRLILSERRGVHRSAAQGLRRVVAETRRAEQAARARPADRPHGSSRSSPAMGDDRGRRRSADRGSDRSRPRAARRRPAEPHDRQTAGCRRGGRGLVIRSGSPAPSIQSPSASR